MCPGTIRQALLNCKMGLKLLRFRRKEKPRKKRDIPAISFALLAYTGYSRRFFSAAMDCRSSLL